MSPVPWWNPNCEALKKERSKAQRQMMRFPTVTNRVCYKKLRGRFQRAQKDAQKVSWMKFVTSVNKDTNYGKIWKRIDKIRGKYRPKAPPILKINNSWITEPREVAATLAEHYASVSLKTKNIFPTEYRRAQSRRVSSFRKKGGHPDNIMLNDPFSIDELETQLEQCKDSAPGPDDITISMIKHLSPQA